MFKKHDYVTTTAHGAYSAGTSACRTLSEKSKRYVSLPQMLLDIKEYVNETGVTIGSMDNPMERTIGFATNGLDSSDDKYRHFYIPLTYLKSSLNKDFVGDTSELRKVFTTSDGR
jgi:hypothetical protein